MIPQKHETWKELEPNSSENKAKRIEESKGDKERSAMETQAALTSTHDDLDKQAAKQLVAVNFNPISYGIVVNFKNAKHFSINISTKRPIDCDNAKLMFHKLNIEGQIRDALVPLVEAAGVQRQ